MEHVFVLLLFFSGSLCTGNNACLGTGTALAVCQPDTCALISELAALREKTEATTQALRSLTDSHKDTMQQMATVEAKLQASNELVQDLKRANQDQDEQLKALKESVARERAKAKVSFSATLGRTMGPVQEDTPVKYPRILSNVGAGYNPATGIFTASVRGLYYFVYTMFNNNSGQTNSVVSLMMNSEKMVSTWDTANGDANDSATNTAVVQLEAGDSVYVVLHATRQLYDDGGHYNSFAGFLLFTL